MLNIDHLSNLVVTQQAVALAAAGTGTTTGDTLDLAGYDAVRAITPIITVLDTAVVTLKAFGGDASDMSDEVELTGNATKTSAADDDLNGTLLILDVVRPNHKYIRFKVVRATANVAIAATIVEKYRARVVPVTQDADVTDIEKTNTPAAV